MPWTLEIHHIDVGSTGDSTLIIARHPALHPHPAQERVVLIDAGKHNHAADVHNYISNTVGLNHVDVVISTHYDKDHFSGVRGLLEQVGAVYDNAILYDQGQPPGNQDYYRMYRLADGDGNIIREHPQRDYLYYIQAINQKPNITRATLMVNSFDIVHYNAGNNHTLPGNPVIPAPGWVENNFYNGIPNPAGGGRLGDRRPVNGQASLPPNWLVGKEVMWGNGGDGTNGRPAFAANNPPIAAFPTLTCIAANKWTQQPGAAADSFVSTVNIYNGPVRYGAASRQNMENGYQPDGRGRPNDNAKSLGFLLEFNGFKYYIAGDLEEHQEDGANNINPTLLAMPGAAVFKNGVRQNLNANNNMAGRVLGLHTSHHGSNTATSRTFVNQLVPSAAFISCSSENQFDHPAQRTVNVLDGYPQQPINSQAGVNQFQHPNRPPMPPHQPVTHYLTGFQRPDEGVLYGAASPFEGRTNGGDASYTAGDPINNNQTGHIQLAVTADQSNVPVTGMVYRALHEAIRVSNARLGAGLTAAEIVAIAEGGARFGGYRAVALAVGASVNAANGALDHAAWVGKDENDQSLVETAHGTVGNAAAATAAITGDARLVGLGAGLAEAVGHTVKADNQAAITAAVTAVHGSVAAAATAAGHAGRAVANGFAPIPGGYAAAAAVGAVNGDAGTTAGQAAAIAMAIGLEIHENLTPTDFVHALYDTSVAAGLGQNAAALGAIAGSVTFFKGVPNSTRVSIIRGLVRQGQTPVNSAADGNAARDAIDLTRAGNTDDLFTVTFHDDNPAYGGGNPRTITHTS